MLHVNKLKGKMTEKGFTVATISEKIGMDSSTFYRKLQKNN